MDGWIKTVLPWLGTALGGPLGGMAAEAVGSVLGISKPTVEGVKKMLSGTTPEQMLLLKQADADFAIKMQALGFEHVETLEQFALENVKSARDMQAVTRSRIPALLASIITAGFLGILALMLTGTYRPTDNQALLILLGALAAGWGSVVNFYFGSSSGSAEKNTILNDVLKKMEVNK